MADDPLPIVFTGSSALKLILLGAGVLLFGIGIVLILDQDGGLVGPAGPFRQQTHPSAIGWMACVVGLVFTFLALLYFARGCPRLELSDEGIVYSRCLSTTRIAWSEFDRADVERVGRGQPIEAVLDYLVLVTTDGRKVVISGPVVPTRDRVAQVHAAITRAAARVRSTPGAG